MIVEPADRDVVARLVAAHARAPALRASRRLWASLLSAALGTRFLDRDTVFVDHTLLATTAEALAHAFAGRPVEGIAEPGLFDWLRSVPEGAALAHDLVRRAARLDLDGLDGDALKALYESAVPPETRKELGEHYTPGWLAEQVVGAAVRDPLRERVLDPAAGAGAFLFHAVRRYVAAAEGAGVPLDGLADHVAGMDVHPVAVAFARVAYLLGIGRERVARRAPGDLRIPVTLGDAMRARPVEVDVLTGNPPWLAYRFMPAEMQRTFRDESEARGLWHGAEVATHQDLSGLFVARAVERHLAPGGRFGFVMPGAVLDRAQFAGFRAGVYGEGLFAVHVAFERPWDLRRLRPHVFPVGAAVVFGRRARGPGPLPAEREVWSGDAGGAVTRRLVSAAPEGPGSPYRARFRNGATLVPRLLALVEETAPASRGKVAIRSARSAYEKRPWRDLRTLEGTVERAFLWPVHLGETLLPYRILAPPAAVLPLTQSRLLGTESEELDHHPGFAAWWRAAERCWNEHRSSERLTLLGQLDYHGKLGGQLPIQPNRIVYAKSGMHLSAARLGDGDGGAIVDHTLYWATAASEAEARYLCAVLNAAVVTRRVRPLMSYGKDERHVDKHVWRLPIPLFDAADARHAALASLGLRAEEAVGALALDGARHFAAARRDVRRFLAGSEVGQHIEGLVEELLR